MGLLESSRTSFVNSLDDSGLGRSLKTGAGNFSEEQVLQNVFSSVFVNKSTGTLVKRSNHLWQLQQWLFEQHVHSIFALNESLLHGYIEHLKQSGRGATVGKQTLQAVTFLFHTVDADKSLLSSLMTNRVKSAADSLMALKQPLKQALPLKSDIVYALEVLIFRLSEQHLKVILGHILFCVYACSRFGDSVELTDLTISYSGHYTVSLKPTPRNTRWATRRRSVSSCLWWHLDVDSIIRRLGPANGSVHVRQPRLVRQGLLYLLGRRHLLNGFTAGLWRLVKLRRFFASL